MNKYKPKKQYEKEREENDILFQKIREEYENGDKYGNFKSVQALAKKYGITKRRIYHRKQKENWKEQKNKQMRKNDVVRNKNVILNGFFLRKVKEFAHLPLPESRIVKLCGTNHQTWIKYKKIASKCMSTLFTYIEENNVNDVDISTLDLAKKSKLFNKLELFAIEFYELYHEGIAKREQELFNKVLAVVNGMEWIEEEEEITDVDGKVIVKKKKKKRKTHPNDSAKEAKWILTHSPHYKNDWVAPNQNDITIEGGERPIVVSEQNKMIEDFMSKFLPEQIPEGEIEE